MTSTDLTSSPPVLALDRIVKEKLAKLDFLYSYPQNWKIFFTLPVSHLSSSVRGPYSVSAGPSDWDYLFDISSIFVQNWPFIPLPLSFKWKAIEFLAISVIYLYQWSRNICILNKHLSTCPLFLRGIKAFVNPEKLFERRKYLDFYHIDYLF